MRRLLRANTTASTLLDFSASIALLCSSLGLIGNYYWFFDLFSHFRIQYLTISCILLLLGFTLSSKNQIAKSLACLSLCVNLIFVIPFLTNGFKSDSQKLEKSISIFSLNLNLRNEQYDLVLNYLQEKKPDYVVLLELTPQWAIHLKKLGDTYPYAYAQPRNDNFGIGILSRHPINKSQIYYEELSNTPFLTISSRVGLNEISIVAVHPFPPIDQLGALSRDKYLSTVASVSNKQTGSKIVCGDFNTTPWSSVFKEFIRQSDLEYFRGNFINTWPAQFFPLGIPIDHCLISKDLVVNRYSKGPHIGSDHYPIEIEVTAANVRSPSNINQ